MLIPLIACCLPLEDTICQIVVRFAISCLNCDSHLISLAVRFGIFTALMTPASFGKKFTIVLTGYAFLKYFILGGIS
jgi:hypothetical protein